MSLDERKAIIYTAPRHSLYIGRVERAFKRVNVASTLLVSLDDDLKLHDPGNRQVIASKSLLIPPGMNLEIDTQGSRLALGFLDDMGKDFARLVPQMRAFHDLGDGQSVYAGLRHENALIQEAEALSRERPATSEAVAQLDGWIASGKGEVEVAFDERVARAASLIRANYTQNTSVAEIARQVNLSVPRLIQLFKQVTGTPIRRYRLWLRIFATAERLTRGFSLTEAALASGFCDYAQFSRVYRELSGGSPSAAKNNTEIRVMRRH
ncbi:AraC family transcriptional regulator [Marinobacteraceae bacterium S3BR75-40.1]